MDTEKLKRMQAQVRIGMSNFSPQHHRHAAVLALSPISRIMEIANTPRTGYVKLPSVSRPRPDPVLTLVFIQRQRHTPPQDEEGALEIRILGRRRQETPNSPQEDERPAHPGH